MSSTIHMGLLQKANLLSQKKGLAFCDFIQKHNIEKIAVFTQIDDYFYIQKSYGFDGISIISSKSTIDFWSGLLIEKGKIYTFSKNDKTFNSLLQFFSFNLKDSVENVCLVRTNSKIYFVCNFELTQTILNEFYSIDETYPDLNIDSYDFKKNTVFSNFTIDFKKSINNFLNSKNLSESIYFTPLLIEISTRLYFLFSINSFFSFFENLIKVSIDSSFKISEIQLKKHIYNTIYDVIETYSKDITVKSEGNSESIAELKNFLKVE